MKPRDLIGKIPWLTKDGSFDPTQFPIDSVLIEQVFINLLENAIKYTPAHSPIDLSASTDGAAVAIEVADRGPGLPPGDEQRIFEKFYRASVPASRNGSGVGLGLTACRGIVEAHGGRIWAENRSGGGAAFRFTLPIGSEDKAADGPTHAGSFELSFLRCIPNMTVMAPADENECRHMLYTAFKLDTPSAVRYPRGIGSGVKVKKEMQALPIGRGEIRRQGERIALLAFGSMLAPCLEASEELNATVVNVRFIKPLDDDLVASLAGSHDLLVTVEENTVMGGAGGAVTESLNSQRICVKVLQVGLPDVFVDQGDHAQMLADCGLDKNGIIQSVRSMLSD